MNWTPEMVERLRSLHKDGVSATLSAKEFGCTRNAVIGKWNRLGMCNTRPRPRATTRVKQPRRARPKLVWSKAADVVVPDFIPDPAAQRALLDLTDEQCHWPTAELFCGSPRFKGSYCAHHYGRSLARYAGVGA